MAPYSISHQTLEWQLRHLLTTRCIFLCLHHKLVTIYPWKSILGDNNPELFRKSQEFPDVGNYTTKKTTAESIHQSIRPTSHGHVVCWKVWGSVQLGALLAAVVLMKTIDQVLPRTGSGIRKKKRTGKGKISGKRNPQKNTWMLGCLLPKKHKFPSNKLFGEEEVIRDFFLEV